GGALPAHLSLEGCAQTLSHDSARLLEMARGTQKIPRGKGRRNTPRGRVPGSDGRESAGVESEEELPARPGKSCARGRALSGFPGVSVRRTGRENRRCQND